MMNAEIEDSTKSMSQCDVGLRLYSAFRILNS